MLKIAYHPIYKHPLPEGHRFPMQKYDLLPKQLMHEGTCSKENFFSPAKLDLEHVLRAHNEQYVNDLIGLKISAREARKIGFPLSQELVDRELIIAQGTITGCEFSFKYGISMNIAGGTHHAYTDRGEAFCMLNDQAIAAHYLLATQQASKILIVDLDVHQGNGTAEIFKNENRVFTFSMHGASNYPFKKETSDLDIPLPNDTGDQEYLDLLYEILPRLIQEQQPDFIFYLCGVDILASDKLGKLGCTLQGCLERDNFVLETCQHYELPVQCSMGGGYSPEIKTIIEAHANTFRIAQKRYF